MEPNDSSKVAVFATSSSRTNQEMPGQQEISCALMAIRYSALKAVGQDRLCRLAFRGQLRGKRRASRLRSSPRMSPAL